MRLSLGGLWRNADFLRLWVGGTASAFGAQIRFLALPLTAILVAEVRGSNPLRSTRSC